MQTVAVITTPCRGIIYINGRFAGETGPEAALSMPVNPHGVLYVEFMPLDRAQLPAACRLEFAEGAIRADSVEEGAFVIKWPGGISEIQLTPRPARAPENDYANLDGLPLAILRGDVTRLRIGGETAALPFDAQLPDSHVSGDMEIFMGDCGAGRYAAYFSRDGFAPLGVISADMLEMEENGIFRAITYLRDTVGHARIETWTPEADGPRLTEAEFAWENGAPDWPRDADAAARAAFEAAILGLEAEAEGYLAPYIRGGGVLQTAARGCDSCVPLRYAPPSPRRAVGLLTRESPRCTAVRPVYYRAALMGGTQGAWLLEDIDAGSMG